MQSPCLSNLDRRCSNVLHEQAPKVPATDANLPRQFVIPIQPGDEVAPIEVVVEDPPPLDPTHHHVVRNATADHASHSHHGGLSNGTVGRGVSEG